MHDRAVVGLFAALGVAFASAGCIQWTFGEDLPYLARLDSAPEGSWSPSLTYQWDYQQCPKPGRQHTLNPPVPDHNPGGFYGLESVVQESGWFASVEDTPIQGDVHLDIKIKLEEWDQQQSIVWMLPVATLFAFPYFVSAKYTVQANARRRDGMQASHTFETGRVAIIWWAVLPLTPFMWEFPLPPHHGEMLQSLVRHLLVRLRRDGFLDKPG